MSTRAEKTTLESPDLSDKSQNPQLKKKRLADREFIQLIQSEIQMVNNGVKTVQECIRVIMELTRESTEGHAKIRDAIIQMAESVRKKYEAASTAKQRNAIWTDFQKCIEQAQAEQEKIDEKVNGSKSAIAALGAGILAILYGLLKWGRRQSDAT